MSKTRYDKGFKPKSFYDLELFFRHTAKLARKTKFGEGYITTELGWNLYADWVKELRKKKSA